MDNPSSPPVRQGEGDAAGNPPGAAAAAPSPAPSGTASSSSASAAAPQAGAKLDTKSELKKILRHALVYGAGNVLGKIVGFIMIPVYTRFLTPADYGVIELLDLTVFILGTLIGYSMTSAVVRYYYQYKEQAERNSLVSTGLIFVAVLSAAATLALIPFSDLLSRLIFESNGYARYFPIVLSTLCCQMIGDFCMAYLQVRQLSVTYTTFSLIKLSLGLALNILFVVVLKLGVLGILYSGLASSLAVSVALCIRTLWQIGVGFSKSQLRTMFVYGYPLILGAFSNFILTFSSRYFLNHFTDLRQVGLYSLGYKLSMLLPVLITNPFITIWSAKRYEIASLPEADEIATKVFTYFAFILIFAATALSALADVGVRLIATPDFYSAARFVPVVTLGYICNGFYYHFNYGLYVKNKTKRVALILFSAAVLNMGMNWVLIRTWHGIGAALASSLSFLFIAVVTLIYSSRLYRLPYEFGRLAKMLGAAAATFWLATLVRFDSLPLALIGKIAVLLVYPLALYLMRFYVPSELDQAKAVVARLRGGKVKAAGSPTP